MERLTGELVEGSQDSEAWRELVVACIDLQATATRLERMRERESWGSVVSIAWVADGLGDF